MKKLNVWSTFNLEEIRFLRKSESPSTLKTRNDETLKLDHIVYFMKFLHSTAGDPSTKYEQLHCGINVVT